MSHIAGLPGGPARINMQGPDYGLVLSNLAIAEATLVKAGKQSALPHFIAIVKELEELYNFRFEALDPEDQE